MNEFTVVMKAAVRRKLRVAGVPSSIRHMLMLKVHDCCSLSLPA